MPAVSSHVDPDRLPKLAAALGKRKTITSRSNKKKSKRRATATQRMPRPPPVDADAYTVDQFCQRHGLSHSFFYKLKAKGVGPRTIKLNSKILITKEAAADWRREREAETAESAA
jgi:hypothetical protein